MLRVFVCSFMTYRAIQQSITDTFLGDVGQDDLFDIILDRSGINKCSFHSQCHVLAFFCVCVCLLISQFTTAPKRSAEVLANVLTSRKLRGHSPLLGELPWIFLLRQICQYQSHQLASLEKPLYSFYFEQFCSIRDCWSIVTFYFTGETMSHSVAKAGQKFTM